MGQNTKFKDFSEDFNGFRSNIKGAKFKNQMKQRKRLEKEAKKLGMTYEEYLQYVQSR